jgi:hypothetical protein
VASCEDLPSWCICICLSPAHKLSKSPCRPLLVASEDFVSLSAFSFLPTSCTQHSKVNSADDSWWWAVTLFSSVQVHRSPKSTNPKKSPAGTFGWRAIHSQAPSFLRHPGDTASQPCWCNFLVQKRPYPRLVESRCFPDFLDLFFARRCRRKMPPMLETDLSNLFRSGHFISLQHKSCRQM